MEEDVEPRLLAQYGIDGHARRCVGGDVQLDGAQVDAVLGRVARGLPRVLGIAPAMSRIPA